MAVLERDDRVAAVVILSDCALCAFGTAVKGCLGAAPDALPFPVSDITKIPMRGLQMFGMPVVIRIMRLRDYLETRYPGRPRTYRV